MAQLQRVTIHPSQCQDKNIALTPKQHHYLERVLRLRPGDRFIALDGGSQQWLAELAAVPTQAVIIGPWLPPEKTLPISIRLIVALPKNGFDQVVRQATELGATHIAPMISDRTLLRPSPQKLLRWRRIACEAMEQSEQLTLPQIQPPTPFMSALQQTPASMARYLCVARRQAPYLLTHLLAAKQTDERPQSWSIATGPEGGWTDAEVEFAIAAGYQPVSLGRGILRAVTAPIVALSLINAAVEFRRGKAGEAGEEGEARGAREDEEAKTEG